MTYNIRYIWMDLILLPAPHLVAQQLQRLLAAGDEVGPLPQRAVAVKHPGVVLGLGGRKGIKCRRGGWLITMNARGSAARLRMQRTPLPALRVAARHVFLQVAAAA